MHEILVDTIGDLTISAYIKEKVLWDIEIDNPHFALQPNGIYEFTVERIQGSIGFLKSSLHQAVITSVRDLKVGDRFFGKVVKYPPEKEKLPEIEISEAKTAAFIPSYDALAQRYAEFSPKITKEDGILEDRDFISEILALKNKEITLPNGAVLTIEETKALTAIDIDLASGDGVMKTNLFAAREIARQMHLRKFGGLVAIDFLRMKDKKHRDDVEAKLAGYFKQSDSRVDFYGFSPSGLYEFSKERVGIPTALHLEFLSR